ncbi:hypothetical protein [Sediminibacter sp. Hel_I_10]|uniref:hypothetical protein n=1 Tax=Sediminibacter sp. Hel_I_10 TaxID=1392490 RepID=UPI00055BF4C3|nr:hypothetical protein [Sediminibacter sp. Hel_I_10]
MRLLYILALATALTACKSETKEKQNDTESVSEEHIELTTAEKIANAHGIEQWQNVEKIEFTFNVDMNGSHNERSWVWMPKSNDVVMMTPKDTVSYNRTTVDSLSMDADKAFVNDKFWLLAPFQLVWDSGTTISEVKTAKAPMSETELNTITTTYSNDGGYTPGDAYDFYFNEAYMIEEWVYRKGNSEAPSMVTSFENYEDFNGIKIAKDHVRSDGDFKLYFTNIAIDFKK